MADEGAWLLGEASGRLQQWRSAYSGVEYTGEVVYAREWREELGAPLPDGSFFRVVLLSAPPPGRAPSPRDRRIAVCLPQRALDWEQHAGARGLRGIREARARYETRPGAGPVPLRGALEEQERALRESILGEMPAWFAGGVMVVGGDAGLQPPPPAGDLDLSGWLAAVARGVLARAYPSPLVALPVALAPVTESIAAELVEGLFGLTPSHAAWATLRRYGAAMGLTPPGFAGCGLVEGVGRLFKEAGGEVAVPDLLVRLAGEWGLPRALGVLGLLAFVASNRPPVELALRPEHRLQGRGGRPFPGDRLTWDLLGDVALDVAVAPALEALRLARPPSARSVAAYAKEIEPSLASWGEPGEEGATRMAAAIGDVHLRVRSSRAALAGLAREFSQPLPAELGEDLALLEAATAHGGLQSFYHACIRSFSSPGRLGDALARARAAFPLAEAASEAVATRSYLEAVPLGGLAGELVGVRSAILAQLDLSALVASPSAWPGLAGQARRFRERYGALYLERHREHRLQSAALRERLARARPRCEALERLNALKSLGPPVAGGVEGRLVALERRLRPCLVAEERVAISDYPLCRECRTTLADSPPALQAEQVLAEVQRGLEEQVRRLATLAVGRILEQPGPEPIDRFLRVVRAADLEALPGVLDDRVMAFLRTFLDAP